MEGAYEKEEEEEDNGDSSSSTSSEIGRKINSEDKIKEISKSHETVHKTHKELQTKIDAQKKVNDQKMKELANARKNDPTDVMVSALFIKSNVFSRELIFYLRTGGLDTTQKDIFCSHA